MNRLTRLLYCLGVFLGAALAFTAGASAQNNQATRAASPGVEVSGSVKDQDGVPIAGATVAIVHAETGERRVAGTGAPPPPPDLKSEQQNRGEHGVYRFSQVPAGRYRMTVEQEGFISQQEGPIDLTRPQQRAYTVDFILYRELAPLSTPRGFIAFGVLLLYLVGIWMSRWYHVASPTREMLLAQIACVDSRLETDTDPAKAAHKDHLEKQLKTVKERFQRKMNVRDFLFWTRGQEIAGWAQVHHVERQLLNILLPDTALSWTIARLRTAEQELRGIPNNPHATALAEHVKSLLTPKEGQEPLTLETTRPMLGEILSFLYDYRDTNFASLATWHNKATWLLWTGTIIVLVLAIAVGRPELFLAGAAGGFLSRLVRSVRSQDVPTDYGAFWTTLFLSPLLGAIAGWFGILLMVSLADKDLKVLGDAFQAIQWNDPTKPVNLALAFVLGFSERLFNGLISALEERAGQGSAAAAAPSRAAPSPTPVIDPSPSSATEPRIAKFDSSEGAPGDKVGATGSNLDVASLKEIRLVPETGGEGVKANFTGGPSKIVLEIPHVAPGSYAVAVVDAKTQKPKAQTGLKLTVKAAPAAAPPKITKLSRTEGKSGEEVVAEGSSLASPNVKGMVLVPEAAGDPVSVTIRQQESNKIAFSIPITASGTYTLELVTEAGRVRQEVKLIVKV